MGAQLWSDTMAAPIDIYYDFRSPYAYFAWWRIRHGFLKDAAWRWRPVSIDALLNLQSGRDPLAPYVDPLAPPKRTHFLADVRRSAEFYGAPLAPPHQPRPDPRPALCAALLLGRGTVPHDAFIDAVFRAMWQQGRDIGSTAILRECLAQVTPDATLLDQALTQAARDDLIAETARAYRDGIFGVPSFVANGEIFFGADRMDMLAWRLSRSSGHTPIG
jgi:2-hydroxychromene-2-carboxylate isomerase